LIRASVMIEREAMLTVLSENAVPLELKLPGR
jgi:hypothetical protein